MAWRLDTHVSQIARLSVRTLTEVLDGEPAIESDVDLVGRVRVDTDKLPRFLAGLKALIEECRS